MWHKGTKLYFQLRQQNQNKSLSERFTQLSLIMNELGFVVTQATNENEELCLQACNCILHDLAQKHLSICQFDLALMTIALGESVEQTRCMAKGHHVCEFLISNRQ